MTISLKHQFESEVEDGDDDSVVRPSDWNAEHVLTMATERVLGRTTASAGDVEELDATALATFLSLGDAAGKNTGTGSGMVAAGDDARFVPSGGTTGQALRKTSNTNYDVGWYTPREVLGADRTYYVRADGSDSNNGLANTSGGAFLTIQKAVDVAATLDLGPYKLLIQLADGTYNENVILKNVVGFAASGDLIIQGNTSDDDAVIVNSASNAAFNALGIPATWRLRYMKLTNNSTGIAALNTAYGALIEFEHLVFGTCNYAQIGSQDGGIVRATNSYAIDGSAQRHIRAERYGLVTTAGRTVTFRGNVAYSSAFAQALQLSLISAFSQTFTLGGFTVTGTRYNITTGSVINTFGGGASYFPGDAAGTTTTGGVYA